MRLLYVIILPSSKYTKNKADVRTGRKRKIIIESPRCVCLCVCMFLDLKILCFSLLYCVRAKKIEYINMKDRSYRLSADKNFDSLSLSLDRFQPTQWDLRRAIAGGLGASRASCGILSLTLCLSRFRAGYGQFRAAPRTGYLQRFPHCRRFSRESFLFVALSDMM